MFTPTIIRIAMEIYLVPISHEVIMLVIIMNHQIHEEIYILRLEIGVSRDPIILGKIPFYLMLIIIKEVLEILF